MRPIQLLAAAVLHNLATALRMWVPRLAPRLIISLAICGALHLALSQMGQVTDLRRAINEDLVRHMFTSMAFLAISGFSLALCIDGLARHPQGLEPGGMALTLALVAGTIGPAWLALNVFGSPSGIDIGTVLALLTAVLIPRAPASRCGSTIAR
jgi:vacuolar-type H+-ATPase subunit I/STV1